MKRLILITAAVLSFNTANAAPFVLLAPLVPSILSALGLGTVAVVGSQSGQSDSKAAQAGINKFEVDELQSIYKFGNIENHSEVAGKLVAFRNIMEQTYGADAKIVQIPGVQHVMAMNIPALRGQIKDMDSSVTVTSFFGTQEQPNYVNLANVAGRVAHVCGNSWKSAREACAMLNGQSAFIS